ncbi:hypothetical protein L596_019192 [Steinernema carpocapsae]|uniref:Uncharacterized protein n=1 Tax=Steinernema carpocapsae TaxID=34508 RepID=A0A4U5MPP9_STECR|nr:hypothetical protein L596_019192 [Steinernema carpocapsae]
MWRSFVLLLAVVVLVESTPVNFFWQKMVANKLSKEMSENSEPVSKTLRCMLLQKSPFFWRRRILARNDGVIIEENKCE